MAKKKLPGASIERNLVVRKVRRDIAFHKLISGPAGVGAVNALTKILDYLNTQPKRTAARKGGLGRR